MPPTAPAVLFVFMVTASLSMLFTLRLTTAMIIIVFTRLMLVLTYVILLLGGVPVARATSGFFLLRTSAIVMNVCSYR